MSSMPWLSTCLWSILSIDRGLDYANKVNKPEVWSRLGKAQLDGVRIKDAIGRYIFNRDVSYRAYIIYRFVHQGRGS